MDNHNHSLIIILLDGINVWVRINKLVEIVQEMRGIVTSKLCDEYSHQ